MARLENWSVIKHSSNPFKAPELWSSKLHGEVYGHPEHEDGHVVTTSALEEINIAAHYAKTYSRQYDLGTMSPEFAAWCEEHGYPTI